MKPPPPTDTFEDLISIVRTLRVECPWDREQTHASIAPLLVEEAYEVKESIEDGNDQELKKELGDILLHAVMHSVMAEERGAFDLNEVIQGISRKLVHRHPHIYADGTAASAEEVSGNWEQLKMKEGRTSIFEGMPKALPALQRADRVQEKASKVGFDWKERRDVWTKVREEIEELEAEVESGASQKRIEEEFGDLLFALVNYARFIDISPEETLQRATTKFIGRFQYIESSLAASGRTLLESNLDEMEELWQAAKRRSGEAADGTPSS